MKYRKLIQIAATTSAVLGTLLTATPVAAQGNTPKHSHYRVVDLGTFGGPSSSYNFGSVIINGRGVVVSAADTSIFDGACGCFTAHGFRWENGVLSDLGTLP